ncbi:unnamed protein product [Lactuca virosa]|uniref:Uncharacterized protein n=1 Tax=Lactuca virosa TaxID=75947 RepID=A0AAU9N780_9ASTR|nr:unnamed protein product [Lactuca virosa]
MLPIASPKPSAIARICVPPPPSMMQLTTTINLYATADDHRHPIRHRPPRPPSSPPHGTPVPSFPFITSPLITDMWPHPSPTMVFMLIDGGGGSEWPCRCRNWKQTPEEKKTKILLTIVIRFLLSILYLLPYHRFGFIMRLKTKNLLTIVAPLPPSSLLNAVAPLLYPNHYH